MPSSDVRDRRCRLLMPALPALLMLLTGRVVLGQQAGQTASQDDSSDRHQIILLDGSLAGSRPGQGTDSSTLESEQVAGKPVIRLTKVSLPTATWYPAGQPGHPAPAMLVLPGGGYQILATDLEGTEVCAWLNQIGISALLLRYRVPTMPPHAEALIDAQSALRLLAANAAKWNVDPKHVGVIGFSAGAHLAARLAALPERAPLAAMMLVYPAYLQGEDKRPVGVSSSLSVPVTGSTPPLFLIQAEDDAIGVGNALAEYEAAAKSKVPAEMHLYPIGGHGYGLRPTVNAVTHWTVPATSWLAGNGFTSGGNAHP